MKFNIAKKLILLTFAFSMLLSLNVYAKTDTNNAYAPYETYTFWQDSASSGSKKPVPSKAIYKVTSTISVSDYGLDKAKNLSDIYSHGGYTYILESDLSTITVINERYEFAYNITEFKTQSGESVSFEGSKGLFVDEKYIYVCGTTQECVWITDKQGNIQETLTLPDSEIIPENYSFKPIRLTIDNKGYIYVLCDGSFYGAILYSPDRKFVGFYGANQVTSNAIEVILRIWNKLFMNDIKKEASIKSLPYQFTDLDVGYNGFIYTITGSSTVKGSIKILNPAGTNVMQTKTEDFGDIGSVIIGENNWVGQDLSELVAEEDFIYVLDKGHGKIFLYDINGNLLGIFGGGFSRGTQNGLSAKASSITVNGDDILVCDQGKSAITIYTITEYGKKLKEAQSLTIHSRYFEAEKLWKEIVKQDQNCQLAYRGLAKAAYRAGKYKDAMKMAKIGDDRDTYAVAFKNQRTIFIKQNFIWIFPLLIVLILGVFLFLKFLNRKNIKLIRNDCLSHMFNCLTHPFDGFAQIKEKNLGSVRLGTVILILMYISSVLKATKAGFIYNYFDSTAFNSLFILVKTVGIIVLWTLINWAVTTLFGGIGKIKEIYIVVTYSTIPLIISNCIYIIFTNVMIPTEAGFLGIMQVIFWIYTLFLLIAGSLKIHDISFGSFLLTALLTIVGIAIVIFLLFLLFMLVQQAYSFIITLVYEMIYR